MSEDVSFNRYGLFMHCSSCSEFIVTRIAVTMSSHWLRKLCENIRRTQVFLDIFSNKALAFFHGVFVPCNTPEKLALKTRLRFLLLKKSFSSGIIEI
jgi:G:T-mismatch repair DNA endonuclease (very short patch repair protein)